MWPGLILPFTLEEAPAQRGWLIPFMTVGQGAEMCQGEKAGLTGLPLPPGHDASLGLSTVTQIHP